MDVDEAQFADHLGVDETTVEGWERGIIVPETRKQKILRDELHKLEPAISLKTIEAMPIISAVHSNSALELCIAASQPYAEACMMMRASELRYTPISHLWGDSLGQAAEALANNEAWKSGECAYARSTILRPDGRWANQHSAPIGHRAVRWPMADGCTMLVRPSA
jgi:hypothetical protein